MKIVKEALAGTLELSDLMVKVAPLDGSLEIVINSEVMRQFGVQIRKVVDETLGKLGVTDGVIVIEDKGALDCAIRARVQAAVLRGRRHPNPGLECAVMTLRRSMLFLPGANAAMLSTAFVYKPDSIMFDLEDAVSLREKDSARLLVFHALQMPVYQGIERVVRINPLSPRSVSRICRRRCGRGRRGASAQTDSAEDVHRLETEV